MTGYRPNGDTARATARVLSRRTTGELHNVRREVVAFYDHPRRTRPRPDAVADFLTDVSLTITRRNAHNERV